MGNLTGSVTGDANIQVLVGRNSSGAIHTTSGNIWQVLAGGDISSNIKADAGWIGTVTAGTLNPSSLQPGSGGTISGTIAATGNIGNSSTLGLVGITAGVDITGTITSGSGDIYLVQALRDMNGEVTADSGELHLAKGGRDVDGDGISADTIDSVVAGRDLDTDVESTEALGTVSAGRTIDGDITSDNSSIGGVAAGSGWSDAFTTSGKINGSTIEAGTGIGNVTVNAALNYDGAIKNATITANDGFIGNIMAVSGIDVTATASESIGNITTPRGDISGSITATVGDIGDVSANAGNISAALTAGEDIGNILAEQNISGNIEAQRNIATGTGQSITAITGKISGNITSDNGNIGDIEAGSDLSGNISADTDIGDVTTGLFVNGDLAGTLTATNGSIGDITAFGKITKAINAGKSIANVWADGNITGNITSASGTLTVVSLESINSEVRATGNISIVAWNDISGKVTGDKGTIAAFAANKITGALTAMRDVTVWATDTITGSIKSVKGRIEATAHGNIQGGGLSAPVGIDAWAGGNISTTLKSDQGSIGAFAWGNIDSTAVAGQSVFIEAGGTISHAHGTAPIGLIASLGAPSASGALSTPPGSASSFGSTVATGASWLWGKTKSAAALGGAVAYDAFDFTGNVAVGWVESNLIPAPLAKYVTPTTKSGPGVLGREIGRDIAAYQGMAEVDGGLGLDLVVAPFAPPTGGTVEIPGTVIAGHGALVGINVAALHWASPLSVTASSATGAFFSASGSSSPSPKPTPGPAPTPSSGPPAGPFGSGKTEVHHLMTNKNNISTAGGGPFTPKFEALAAKRGINLKNTMNELPLLDHSGPHPAYNAEVFKRLDSATEGLKEGAAFNKAFDAALLKIRTETATVGTLLNRLATGG